MYKLHLDTSTRENKEVSLLKEGKVIYKVKTSGDIFVEIQKILERNGLAFCDIDYVDINKGPGSFTGLKIGASIANTFNYTKGNIKRWEDLIIPNYGKKPNIKSKTGLLEK